MYSHNPYNFAAIEEGLKHDGTPQSQSPSSRPISPAARTLTPVALSSQSVSPALARSITPTFTAASSGIRPQEVHRQLEGVCDYLVPPAVDEKTHPAPQNCPILFLGQIRTELKAGQLSWIIQTVSVVQPVDVRPRGVGSFDVYLRNEDDANVIRSLHKRLLFDVKGVWFASNDQATAFMRSYVQGLLSTGSKVFRKSRLPQDMMVVEEKRFSRGPKNRNNNNNSSNNTGRAISPSSSMSLESPRLRGRGDISVSGEFGDDDYSMSTTPREGSLGLTESGMNASFPDTLMLGAPVAAMTPLQVMQHQHLQQQQQQQQMMPMGHMPVVIGGPSLMPGF